MTDQQQYLQQAIAKAKAILAEGDNLDAYVLLGRLYHMVGDYRRAAKTLIKAHGVFKDDTLAEMIGVYLANDGQDADALPWLERALATDGDNLNANTALACSYGRLGETELARVFGNKALTLRHEQALASSEDEPMVIHRAQQATAEGDLIISFSLWGGDKVYLDGAIENVRHARVLFPEWQVRFYLDDSVPPDYIVRLLAEGADIIKMPPQSKPYEGLFWRFLVASDPGVSRFMVRDADSVLSLRDRRAIDAWIQSDKAFHVVRDGYSHTSLILAGLWAGKGCLLADMPQYVGDWVEGNEPSPSWDQTFLGAVIWPLIYKHTLIHDRCFTALGAKEFPEVGRKKDRYLGKKDMLMAHHHPNIGHYISAMEPSSASRLSLIVCPDPVTAIELETALSNAGLRMWQEGVMDGTIGMIFAKYGFNIEVRSFWRQALAGMDMACQMGEQPVMVSGFGLQSGLVESILEQNELQMDVVFVDVPPLLVAGNLVAWGETLNQEAISALGLSFEARNKIVTPEPLNQYGEAGLGFWLAVEQLSRLHYYQHVLGNAPHVRCRMVSGADTAQLLAGLYPELEMGEVERPDALPQVRKQLADQLMQMNAGANFSVAEMGKLYFDQGRILG